MTVTNNVIRLLFEDKQSSLTTSPLSLSVCQFKFNHFTHATHRINNNGRKYIFRKWTNRYWPSTNTNHQPLSTSIDAREAAAAAAAAEGYWVDFCWWSSVRRRLLWSVVGPVSDGTDDFVVPAPLCGGKESFLVTKVTQRHFTSDFTKCFWRYIVLSDCKNPPTVLWASV